MDRSLHCNCWCCLGMTTKRSRRMLLKHLILHLCIVDCVWRLQSDSVRPPSRCLRRRPAAAPPAEGNSKMHVNVRGGHFRVRSSSTGTRRSDACWCSTGADSAGIGGIGIGIGYSLIGGVPWVYSALLAARQVDFFRLAGNFSSSSLSESRWGDIQRVATSHFPS